MKAGRERPFCRLQPRLRHAPRLVAAAGVEELDVRRGGVDWTPNPGVRIGVVVIDDSGERRRISSSFLVVMAATLVHDECKLAGRVVIALRDIRYQRQDAIASYDALMASMGHYVDRRVAWECLQALSSIRM